MAEVDADVAVVVAAGGAGVRLGAGVPKALQPLAGQPLVWHVVRRMVSARSVGCVVVVAPAGHEPQVRAALADRPDESGWAGQLLFVAGGADRQRSVAAGLAAVPLEFPIVLVHDAARTLAPASLVEDVAAAVRGAPAGAAGSGPAAGSGSGPAAGSGSGPAASTGPNPAARPGAAAGSGPADGSGAVAVIPVLPVTDTISQVDPAGQVVGSPDRSRLRAVQTPQGFRREVLAAAHAAAGTTDPASSTVTDDAGLVARLGLPVRTIPGSPYAMKITTRLDLLVAETLLREAPPGPS